MATYIDRNILTQIYQNSKFTFAEAGKVQKVYKDLLPNKNAVQPIFI